MKLLVLQGIHYTQKNIVQVILPFLDAGIYILLLVSSLAGVFVFL